MSLSKMSVRTKCNLVAISWILLIMLTTTAPATLTYTWGDVQVGDAWVYELKNQDQATVNYLKYTITQMDADSVNGTRESKTPSQTLFQPFTNVIVVPMETLYSYQSSIGHNVTKTYAGKTIEVLRVSILMYVGTVNATSYTDWITGIVVEQRTTNLTSNTYLESKLISWVDVDLSTLGTQSSSTSSSTPSSSDTDTDSDQPFGIAGYSVSIMILTIIGSISWILRKSRKL